MNERPQPDLFDWIGTPDQEADFAEFDAAHPEVWRLYERFALDLVRRGFEHHSSDAVLHRVRWETDANTGGKPWKINNNFTPMYARKFHRAHPHLAGFFRTRRSRADDAA